ncbi:hypothetical protein WJX74_010881 [Apatococcus lobatus]|uniref:Trichohyalin-plectin-homology domain-containing protein n=1 Tax=Apatococcus lobatus TaxID=904363 RepID=A0AAW1S6X5_9CHLO
MQSKASLRRTLEAENSKDKLSERVPADWGPAKLRSLLCSGDPMYLQHADLLPARTTERVVDRSKFTRSTPKVQKLCVYKQGYAGARPPQQAVAADTIEREYCYRLHSEWPLLDALHAQLDHLSTHERRKRLQLLQATQRGWLDDQVAAKDGPRQQAQQAKVLEAQEMERALAKYMQSLREKEEQQRCKARKLKADCESQVKEAQARRHKARQDEIQADLDQAALDQKKDEEKQIELEVQRQQQRESMLQDSSNNQRSIRAKKELAARERQQDKEQQLEYDRMLSERAAASEAALAAIRLRYAARSAGLGDWIAKKEKERQDKDDAAVSKWQEEQAAKQAATIAAAMARQKRIQMDLEQAWTKQQQMKQDRQRNLQEEEVAEAQEMQDIYNRTRYLQESWMTADERKLNSRRLRQALPLKAIIPGQHKCFLPPAVRKTLQ